MLISDPMDLAIGYLVLGLGLLGSLVRAHLRERRFFDRPTLARSPLFDPVLNLARWTLILAGLYLVAASSAVAGAVTAGVLVLLLGYLMFIRSTWYQTRRIRQEFELLKRIRPGASDRELLHQMTCARHPRWGPELVEQMLIDFPTLEELAPIIVKMEKGFRSFRPH